MSYGRLAIKYFAVIYSRWACRKRSIKTGQTKSNCQSWLIHPLVPLEVVSSSSLPNENGERWEGFSNLYQLGVTLSQSKHSFLEICQSEADLVASIWKPAWFGKLLGELFLVFALKLAFTISVLIIMQNCTNSSFLADQGLKYNSDRFQNES